MFRLVQELVELVLTDLQNHPGSTETPPTCLEVGCGSGAISLSLLKSLPQVSFVVIIRSSLLASPPCVIFLKAAGCTFRNCIISLFSGLFETQEQAADESPGNSEKGFLAFHFTVSLLQQHLH